jgi:L-asparaginase / beta-aspartyl-peptidase
MTGKYSLAIHGGAGIISRSLMPEGMEKKYLQALENALAAGSIVLKQGGTAVDAVLQTVKSMEDCPFFNAGKGAVFTSDGGHELDASVMSGDDLRAGAVSAVKHVKNPVLLAKAIMDDGNFVHLNGKGAEDFARKNGLEMVEMDYFFTKDRYEQWLSVRQTDKILLDHDSANLQLQNKSTGSQLHEAVVDHKYGTVGAAAMDMYGNLAAATSTGGLTNKRFGRLGDSSMIGIGTYANNNSCAISCTGYGEYFIRSVVAYDISCLMEYKGLSLKEACEEVVLKKLVAIEGEGGVIGVDKSGRIELCFNSEGMYRGSTSSNDPILRAYIYK